MNIKPIGIIHTPFKTIQETPIQYSRSKAPGSIEVFPEFEPGLKDVENFSHLILLYEFHKANETLLEVKPFLDNSLRGIYSCRHPNRPNHIGLSVVRLIKINKNILSITNIDVLDGTPLLDIKPYISDFDSQTETKSGWFEDRLK